MLSRLSLHVLRHQVSRSTTELAGLCSPAVNSCLRLPNTRSAAGELYASSAPMLQEWPHDLTFIAGHGGADGMFVRAALAQQSILFLRPEDHSNSAAASAAWHTAGQRSFVSQAQQTPSAKQLDKHIIYRGPWLLPFRMLVRMKIIQLSWIAVLALPIHHPDH